MFQFLSAHRDQIVARAIEKRLTTSPQTASAELATEITLFMDALIAALCSTAGPTPELVQTASRQGHQMQLMGMPLDQVVYVYGDVCQIVTELASQLHVTFSSPEYHAFNKCLDHAIAEAVTAYARAAEPTAGEAEHVGFFAHELRNSINTALLAFDVLKRGQVDISGSTGNVLYRSLLNLQGLVERELVSVRLQAGMQNQQPIGLVEFIYDVAMAATVQAQARNLRVTVMPIEPGLAVKADRQLLTSALTNLVQNALKFSRAHGEVILRVQTTADRVRIEVEDECGGLPTDNIAQLFRPFEQQSPDRSGLGLGLSISQKAVHASGGEISVRDLPGKGCVFVIELPKQQLPA